MWSITKLRGIPSKLGAEREIKLLDCLLSFYESGTKLHTALAAYRDSVEGNSNPRERATALCSSFTTWRNGFTSLSTKSPDFACDAFRLKVEGAVNNIFTSSWKSIMAQPANLVRSFATAMYDKGADFVDIDDSFAPSLPDLTAAMESCNDASFLATGLSNATSVRQEFEKATEYMKCQLDAIKELKAAKESQTANSASRTLNAFFGIFKALMAKDKEDDDNLRFSLDMTLSRDHW